MSNNQQEQESQPQEAPIVNCHTHIFTGDYVPPYLARTFLPEWCYKIINTSWLIRKLRERYGENSHDDYFEEKRRRATQAKRARAIALSASRRIGNTILQVLTWWLIVNTAVVVFDSWFRIFPVFKWLRSAQDFLNEWAGWSVDILVFLFPLYYAHGLIQFVVVILSLLLVKRLRKVFLLIAGKTGLGKVILGDMTRDLIKRYLQLGHYARYKQQWRIFKVLRDQHPPDSQFVVLPMDMQYMGAGDIKPTDGSLPSEYREDIKGWSEFARNADARRMHENASKDEKEQSDQRIEKAKTNIARIKELKSQDHYYLQLNKIRDIKRRHGARIRPFIFVDPRRIRDTWNSDRPFFKLQSDYSGELKLDRCVFGDYLFDKWDQAKGAYDADSRSDQVGFSGIKIYPALGYYPFDRYLLPLWAYAVQNDVPIMTHCTRGVIFYRGKDIESRNYHPVLVDAQNKTQLPLAQSKNVDYQVNFTHPLNYLCLLDERLLDRYIRAELKSPDLNEELKTQLRTIFYDGNEDRHRIQSVLRDVKICLGHYGGWSHWERFYNEERSVYSTHLYTHPERGAMFHKKDTWEISWKKLEDNWNDTDWFTIATSLMLQYPNIYSDISYTLHKTDIFPLLKRVLSHQRGMSDAELNELNLPSHELGHRVLYGTDFYVVRSNKSDRHLLMETQARLSEEEFDQIARHNPKRFLATRYERES